MSMPRVRLTFHHRPRTMTAEASLYGPNIMYLFRVAILTCCLLFGACNFGPETTPAATPNENNIVYVTATPHVVVAQAAPTEAAPSLPPTPTIEPAVLIQLGDNFMRNGYLEDAAGMYRALLNQGASTSPDYRALAAFRLGQVALRDGYFQQGFDAFNQLITEFPDSAYLPQSYFLRGDARLGLAQWGGAVTDFQHYLSLRPGLIDSYAYERIADAQIALGQTNSALQHYELAINAKRSKVPLLVLREKLAGIYISLSRAEDAVAQYDAILTVARNVPYRAYIAFAAAQTLLENDLKESGLARMQQVFDDYSETVVAYDALNYLIVEGISYDGLQRGKSAYIAGDYPAVIDVFNTFTSSHRLADIPAELHLLLGRAYRQIGNDDAAMVAFQTVIDLYPQDALFGDALLEQGRTRFLAGDSPAAIQIYLAIADEYDYLIDAAGEALWRAGYLYGTNGDPARSREVFMRLADAYPNHELTNNGMFIAASAAVRDEQWAIAENLYSRIANLTAGDDRAAAYLWVGRLASSRGDQTVANDAFQLAAASAPDSYFAARADDFRSGRTPFQPPVNLQFDFDINADVAAAEGWLRRNFSLEQTGDLWRLSDDLNVDPHMIRGRELFCGRRL